VFPKDVVIAYECVKSDVLLFENIKEVSSTLGQRQKIDVLTPVKQIPQLDDCGDVILLQIRKKYCGVEFFIKLVKVLGVISNAENGCRRESKFSW
jgi:hypothetical protein